jgi:N-acetyl-gamma-glutamyl-phosphate reductase
MLMYPLVSGGIVPKSYPITCHAVTGYSGGGKELIAEFETNSQSGRTPAFYALGLQHKHLPEMQKHSGLDTPPLFTPIIGNCGMSVAIPLKSQLLGGSVTANDVGEFLKSFYAGRHFVKVFPPREADATTDGGRFYADAVNGTNNIELFVFGNENDILLIARLDNLGKGASGQAVQNMNIMFGIDEKMGL